MTEWTHSCAIKPWGSLFPMIHLISEAFYLTLWKISFQAFHFDLSSIFSYPYWIMFSYHALIFNFVQMFLFSWTLFRSLLMFSLISLNTCSTIVLNSSSGLSSESFSLGIITWIDRYKSRHSSLTFHITCVFTCISHQELDQLNFKFIMLTAPLPLISGSIFNVREEVVIDWVTSLLFWPHGQGTRLYSYSTHWVEYYLWQ